jgi:hypothetical protein
MNEMAGRHLDPHLFALFLRLLPAMRRIRSEVTDDEQDTVESTAEMVCA